jgi:hypothetical protein
MLPLFFLLTLDDKDSNKRQQLVESIIPSMVPGPPTQRLALSAVLADGQIDTQRRREETIASEVTIAISKASANADKKLADADLSALPNLAPVIGRSAAVRQQVDAVALAADQHEKAAVLQAGNAVFNDFFQAIQKSLQKDGKKLSETELAGFTALAPVMNSNQGIKNLFVSAAGTEAIELDDVKTFPGTATQRSTGPSVTGGATSPAPSTTGSSRVAGGQTPTA